MSQDAHQKPNHRLKSLVGLGFVVVFVGAAAIRGASPSLNEPQPPAPLLSISLPKPAAPAKTVPIYRIEPRAPLQPVPLTLRRSTKGWTEFEAEYGIKTAHRSPILEGIQLAKYTVDELTFGADQFLKNLGNALEFEYRSGGWRYAPTLGEEQPVRRAPGIFENTKFRVDVALQDGGPYLGVRLVVPFGR